MQVRSQLLFLLKTDLNLGGFILDYDIYSQRFPGVKNIHETKTED